MNNAEKFQEVFGYYATEMWAKPEAEFLDWINEDYNTPTTRTGKWYISEYEYFTCDQCGEDVWNSAEYTQEARDMLKNGEYPNFCPNCGAYMRGDDGE